MTQYCNIGDKPRVTYKFNSAFPVDVQMSTAPIDVQSGKAPNQDRPNYNPEGYQITFSSPRVQFGTISATVTDYKITYLDRGVFNSDTAYYIKIIPCGEKEFPPDENGLPGIKMSSPNVTINNAVKCPIKDEDNSKCEIKILNNGAVVFSAQGECPVNFTVACGRCPEGTCECKIDAYPGYCCLDCNSTAASIRAITNDLRGKNG